VQSYTGYVEYAAAPMRRLEVPFAGIPLILSFGPTLLVDGVRHRSFVAGLDAPCWEARFALLDAVLLQRLHVAAPVAPEVEHAWARLRASHGAVVIATLAEEVGWSRRHLAARFKADVGLPPKTVARVLRFQRVTQTLRRAGRDGLAEVAYACGYADQAHLNRDFRAFAGTTPTDFAARLLPGGAGVAGHELPNVQDALSHAA
jgi:AraC-like DNA-binding protein